MKLIKFWLNFIIYLLIVDLCLGKSWKDKINSFTQKVVKVAEDLPDHASNILEKVGKITKKSLKGE